MYSTSGAPLRYTAFAIKCTAYSIMFIRSLTWVYCICQQVHWIYHQVFYISYHVNQEPHMVYFISQTGVLHMPSSNTMNNTGCTTLAIKCTAEAMLYFRSPTWVHFICNQVYCRGNHVQYIRSPLRYTAFAIKCTAYPVMFIRSLTWVYCIC